MTNPNDMFKDFDPTKMMNDLKLPGVDMQALAASQRKNLEALTAANQAALQGMQAVAKRQAEIFKQTMDQAGQAMRDMMGAGAPEDKAARQAEIAKAAFQTALGNMRELAEMVAKAQTDANEVITRRVTDSIDEFKDAVKRPR